MRGVVRPRAEGAQRYRHLDEAATAHSALGLTEAELADRSTCSVSRIQELVGLGILVPREEGGPFHPKDVHRVRLMRAFEDAGIELDLIARGVRAGKLSYENLTLYDASMGEWAKDASLPIETD